MRTLQCDVDQEQTPAVLRKVSIAVARDRSYAVASRNLEDLAELKISAKQCQRIAIRIGTERLDEQQERIERYCAASLPDQHYGQSNDAPLNDWSGRVAVVQGDGGRAQIRDELWGKEKSGDKKHRWWRETQAGVLQTYLSTPSDADPHPEVPECLRDTLWIVPKLNEIHRIHSAQTFGDSAGNDEKSTSPSNTQAVVLPAKSKNKRRDSDRWSGGEPLVRTIIATRQGYDHLGLVMAAEAFHRGFNKAKMKAFMGDGLKVNWSLWARHFSHYTPIVDIMHALSYVYAAAIASEGRLEDGWNVYLQWLNWVWSGQTARVIIALEKTTENASEVSDAIRRAITYLKNNQSRMKYDQYRRDGLPITTSPVESAQKQINERIKGTEKFWRDASLEPLLQLKSDDLSESYKREAFWQRRGKKYDGFRHPRRKTTIEKT